MKNYINDTIVAPSTANVNQAISIIRMSGDDAFLILNKIIKKPLILNNKPQLRLVYENDVLIDEVVVIHYINPNTFTGENIVEINCHGGKVVTNKIISLLIENGARIAQNGEFSKRAYLNGKIDLLKAESINQLIMAKNEAYVKINAKNFVYKNKTILQKLKSIIIDVISKLQVAIDYPEYDEAQEISNQSVKNDLLYLEKEFEKILLYSKWAKAINDGINVAIVGEPNVGKSSLLNALLNEDRAIISEFEGTTRDVIEGKIYFKNFTINLMDTAGIRKTKDYVENIGINKSLDKINDSDLVLFVVTKDKLNLDLYKKISNKKHVILINKIDKLTKNEIKEIERQYSKQKVLKVSAKENKIYDLLNYFKNEYDREDFFKSESIFIGDINQQALFEIVYNKIRGINNDLKNLPIDLIAMDLNEIHNSINELLGEGYEEEIIENIFKKYCLGK